MYKTFSKGLYVMHSHTSSFFVSQTQLKNTITIIPITINSYTYESKVLIAFPFIMLRRFTSAVRMSYRRVDYIVHTQKPLVNIWENIRNAGPAYEI